MRLILGILAALSFAGDAHAQRRQRVAPVPAFATVAAVPARVLDYKFPAGTTVWTTPLVIEGQTGFAMTGTRTNGVPSRAIYRGPPTAAFIRFVGCTRCKLIDLEIVIETAGVDAAVLITNAVDPPSLGWSTANVIQNVRVLDSGNGKAAKRAFAVDSYAAGGRDGNNEQHRFIQCMAQSYSESGFYFRGSQCHQLVCEQCAALDYGGRRPIGLLADEGAYFVWRDGSMTANKVDFQLNTFEQQILIENASSEQSTQFLVMGKAGGDAVVSIKNARVDCKPEAGKPIIDGHCPNIISVRDSWFAGTNGLCPTIRVGGSGGSIDLSGVMLRQHGGTTPLGPLIAVPSSADTRQHGLRHQYIPAAGPRVTKKIVVNTLGVQ